MKSYKEEKMKSWGMKNYKEEREKEREKKIIIKIKIKIIFRIC